MLFRYLATVRNRNMPLSQLGLNAIVTPKGAQVFQEGDPGECAFLIESGRVEISIQRDGQRIRLAERGPGEIFGEMAIIDGRPRTATITALDDCELLAITTEQLNRRIDAADPILKLCLTIVLDRFRAAMNELHGAPDDDAAETQAIAPRPLAEDYANARDALDELKLEREIADGIRRQEFELFFQPIVDLQAGALAGFESLVRWRHPERGLVPPDAFIPIAEASGLIAPLSRLCLQQACRAQATMAAGRDLFIGVNLSGHDFSQADFVDNVGATLRETGADPAHMKLEITETALVQNPEQAAAALDRCRDMGVRIAIDDFGAGYSSLGYLHRFPIDTLKVDRSFISAMLIDHRSMKIVQSVLGMADKLHVPVVAEGIETADQADALREMGCKYGQGYHFARPLPRDEAEDLIRSWRTTADGVARAAS